ncbi:SMC-Scp complex subunit ScpB [Wohlfahrtiimonas chitiniclastica]|uniref:Putative segregation and condensation protein B n=1 Tax=Wohlfahrtiimonas chitiniclastica SH04 TaxID=1261130 RepID=L8XZM8_9GAMM|nr:SMC-Scp complex subunit ScpB [Wohlfahrtiimonas chitiniclastica]ELV07761.1 Putative segregation and condensation protein B [Wohlfahrtiimonas chitiniclastica SH04]MBS7815442.1 SMC-Scp complex subunit ScpB [Wohlfahrtiimonas chitiniclastica]MBS7817612.1 SMC-Scp complex subunit ScpB [Wohlfahrtiimonas chitiniclastica]MBS7821233.1 SMC-Scp complex subunit ScpB [Wohlfahrtiimonas chitiniclastica]MBS7823443.1 SMC-Scp complex subunit ScpB [Wohlfahrtiimonas chitiniclastica]
MNALPPLNVLLEAILSAARTPLKITDMQALFELHEQPSTEAIKEALTALKYQLEGRGVELVEVASGYRIQVPQQFSPWVSRLFDEKPQRYSRALLETLALIAYRQPISRGDIEEIRGVAVSSNIIKTLLEREWIKVLGQREVPGRPNLYGTTKQFLDDFNLKQLSELPPLIELEKLESTVEHMALSLDTEEA